MRVVSKIIRWNRLASSLKYFAQLAVGRVAGFPTARRCDSETGPDWAAAPGFEPGDGGIKIRDPVEPDRLERYQADSVRADSVGVNCASGSPSSADRPRAADMTCSLATRRCSSSARIVGIDAPLDP